MKALNFFIFLLLILPFMFIGGIFGIFYGIYKGAEIACWNFVNNSKPGKWVLEIDDNDV